jgi:putative transposase
MDEYASLNHTKWECKYHVVFIPKGRRKALYGQLRPQLAEVFDRVPRFGVAGRSKAVRSRAPQ